MRRRDFMQLVGTTLAVAACTHPHLASRPSDAARYRTSRRFVALPSGRIAYVERGSGPAALFLHGAPLNGFQWRGALDRLSNVRRCIALDFMGLGYSEVPEHQALGADAQVTMLAAFLDALSIEDVDLVASDSGGAVAQLFVARHPARVRTLLVTNCDVEPDSPPPKVMPAIEMARAGTLADATAKWLTDPALARSTFGAAVFRDPAQLTDEVLAYYVTPLVASPLRRAQYHAFHVALAPNPLAGVEAALKRSTVPVRIVWGTGDDIFEIEDAEYLAATFPESRGIRRVSGGKLFFPEEEPDVIAEEARRLWTSTPIRARTASTGLR